MAEDTGKPIADTDLEAVRKLQEGYQLIRSELGKVRKRSHASSKKLLRKSPL